MAKIVITDLEMGRELDARAMSNMMGGAVPSRDTLIGGLGNGQVSRAGGNMLTAGSGETEIVYALFVVT